MDNNAPASDAVGPVDGREQVAQGEYSLPVVGVVDSRPASGRRLASRARARIGRPTTLTPRLGKKLVKLVTELGAIEPAARVCGVPPQTVRGWLARGEDRHSQGRPPTREYVAFVAAIEKALGQWECDRLAGIAAAAKAKPENWTAHAWLLERRWPDRYGRRTRVDVSGTLTVVEMRAFFLAVVELLERYVPAERHEAEIANLVAVVDEIAGPHRRRQGG